MPFVESLGRRVYYERHAGGPGSVVLFLHGAGSNAATWWQQLPAFATRHTCITMDIRCFGRSAAPLSEFTIALFVADVLAVLDCEDVQHVMLVGQSLGGMIGLRLALEHSGRIAAFIACDSPLAIDHPVLLQAMHERQLTQHAVSIEQRSLGQWFLRNHPDKAALYAQINHFNPSAHSIPGADWGAALGALMQPDQLVSLERLRDIGCPTLLLVGRQDPLVSVAVMEEVAALIPGSELAVIEDAGHSAYFEHPAEFNRRVMEFIARRVAD